MLKFLGLYNIGLSVTALRLLLKKTQYPAEYRYIGIDDILSDNPDIFLLLCSRKA
jgi:hypothetical protein